MFPGKAIEVWRALESNGVRVSGGLLRAAFEGLPVPEDVEHVLREMMTPGYKATASRLREIGSAAKLDRHWKWVILHPGLGPDRIDPTRSMHVAYILHIKWVTSSHDNEL